MKTEDRGLRMEDGGKEPDARGSRIRVAASGKGQGPMKRMMETGGEVKGPCAALTGLGEQLRLTQGDARGLACPGLRYGGPSGLRRRRGHRPNACIHNGDLREH